MGVKFTEQQQRVIDARGHNILVSAAAGSGKTAVLVERIVKLVTEGDRPLDIDRLLVVTFTKAAAAEMRERIAKAIASKLEEDPENRHLQKQETLLHNAEITTIDSFCAFLLRNNFGDIGLDPGYRQMDEMEAQLLKSDALDECLEEQYAAGTPELLACCDYFCSRVGDEELKDRILDLYRKAMSHPWPEAFLNEREKDYDVSSPEDLMTKEWFRECLDDFEAEIREYADEYDELRSLSDIAGGPFIYADFLADEQERLKEIAWGSSETDYAAKWNRLAGVRSFDFKTMPAVRGKVKNEIDSALKDAVKDSRDRIKKQIQADAGKYFADDPEMIARKMSAVRGPLRELVRITRAFAQKYAEKKREKNVIDFDDLEHFALEILIDRHEDGTETVRPAAMSYREHFAEILIDEYQDSNDVQELLLRTISGEDDGRYDRFMVGDVKQSIYKFRLARPEIFMEKFMTYRPGDARTERIDLDRNFRSRAEVLDAVNAVFRYICRPEIGGVDYDDAAALKLGNTSYPSYPDAAAELLVINDVTDDGKSTAGTAGAGKEGGAGENGSGYSNTNYSGADSSGDGGSEGTSETDDGINAAGGISVEELNRQQKEALAIAHRIHDLIRNYKVTDGKTGTMRPCRYGDMVILLRATAGWDEEFREVFEQEGIPCYVASKAGYFGTEEIREILDYMRVLDNPRQDIPLYGALTGYFGGFTDEELAFIRGEAKQLDFYSAIAAYAGKEMPSDDHDPALAERLCRFLDELDAARESLTYLSIHEFLTDLVARTGYENYITALPAGGQRRANLEMLLGMALDFEKTSYTGLFRFIRYIDQMKVREIDFGEANILDENADVVRIMTIHKSKGLEFPIVFCAGLTKQLNKRDASGTFLLDNALGLGLDYADSELRVRESTLRKEVIADRIRRDSLGEELRVLYVALTRAREKLILTAYVKDLNKKKDAAAMRIRKGIKKLPVNILKSTSCYYDLLLNALTAMEANGEPMPIGETVIDSADLEIREAEETTGSKIRRAALEDIGRAARTDGIRALPEPEYAEKLLRTYRFRYPHEDLKGLYTKTTVTELKRAARRKDLSEDGKLAEAAEGIRLYPRPEAGAAGGSAANNLAAHAAAGVSAAGNGNASGAVRGTIIHRFLSLFDYQRFQDSRRLSADELRGYIRELTAVGQFNEEEASFLTPGDLLPFLTSELAERMARAAARGRLRKEQPFVMGIAADRIDPKFPAEETLLIQGIIDAYFEEDGKLIVVDYKTDRVKTADELITRYRVQLDYYKEALHKMYDLPVSEELIYSFALRRVVPIL